MASVGWWVHFVFPKPVVVGFTSFSQNIPQVSLGPRSPCSAPTTRRASLRLPQWLHFVSPKRSPSFAGTAEPQLRSDHTPSQASPIPQWLHFVPQNAPKVSLGPRSPSSIPRTRRAKPPRSPNGLASFSQNPTRFPHVPSPLSAELPLEVPNPSAITIARRRPAFRCLRTFRLCCEDGHLFVFYSACSRSQAKGCSAGLRDVCGERREDAKRERRPADAGRRGVCWMSPTVARGRGLKARIRKAASAFRHYRRTARPCRRPFAAC